jgi:mRNA interferase MazF
LQILQAAKRRPALVVATCTGEDVLLGQMTSQAVSDSYAISLRSTDCSSGRLTHDSNMRPNRLFTADSNIILYRAGVLKPAKLQEVIAKIGDYSIFAGFWYGSRGACIV